MRVIFSHIPKNAGSSIVSALRMKQYASEPFFTLKHEPWHVRKIPGFKFTFVRNPYSRAVSLFFYYLGQGKIQEDNFLDFCRNLHKYNHLIGKSQTYWLDGAIWDFVGSVESIYSDFNILIEMLGLSPTKLNHRNKTKHEYWKNYYCPESYRIITEHFKSDFERLHYAIEKRT